MSSLLNKKPFWFCCGYNQVLLVWPLPSIPLRDNPLPKLSSVGCPCAGIWIWSVPCCRPWTALPPRPLPSPPSATLVSLPLLGIDAASGLTCFPADTARSAAVSAGDHGCSCCTRAPGLCSGVRTVPQVHFLFHILGLSSRHLKIFKENSLSGGFWFFWLSSLSSPQT